MIGIVATSNEFTWCLRLLKKVCTKIHVGRYFSMYEFVQYFWLYHFEQCKQIYPSYIIGYEILSTSLCLDAP